MSENRVHGQCYLSVSFYRCMDTEYLARSTLQEINSSVAPCRPAFWNRRKNVQAITSDTRQSPAAEQVFRYQSPVCRGSRVKLTIETKNTVQTAVFVETFNKNHSVKLTASINSQNVVIYDCHLKFSLVLWLNKVKYFFVFVINLG